MNCVWRVRPCGGGLSRLCVRMISRDVGCSRGALDFPIITVRPASFRFSRVTNKTSRHEPALLRPRKVSNRRDGDIKYCTIQVTTLVDLQNLSPITLSCEYHGVQGRQS